MKDYSVLDELIPKTEEELHRTIFDKGYEQGLEDAWECAKKIALNQCDNGINVNVLSRIFKVGSDVPYKIFKNFSVQEAIYKIKALEEEQEVVNLPSVNPVAKDNNVTTKVLEDIKAELCSKLYTDVNNPPAILRDMSCYNNGILDAVKIIDKHIS